MRAPVKIERQDTPGIRYREDLTWISSRYQFDLHLMLHAYPEEILVLRATRLQRALERRSHFQGRGVADVPATPLLYASHQTARIRRAIAWSCSLVPCVHPSWAMTATQSVHVCRVKPVPWWAGTLVWNASANPRPEVYLA